MNGDAIFGLKSPGARRPWWTVLIGASLVVLWQVSLVSPWAAQGRTYGVEASTGLDPQTRDFLYFYFTLGLFPLAPPTPPFGYTVEDARALLSKKAVNLKTQSGYFPRHGNAGRIWLFLPHAWWTGSAENPRVEPFHAGVFITALVAVFVASAVADLTMFGAILVLLVGSHPFQIYEVFGHENVFGWPISASLLLLALHLPLIASGEKSRRFCAPFATALATGSILGTLAHIRSEPVILVLPAIVVYASMSRARRAVRWGSIVLVLISFMSTAAFWSRYFEAKTREANTIVTAAGGHVFSGQNAGYHPFWHAIFCGLGDFAENRGYHWRDSDAYAYAAPILRLKLHADLTEINPYCYDVRPLVEPPPGLSCDTLEVLPEYEGVLRRKILADIGEDPLWYVSVLARRAGRIVSDAVPLQIRVGSGVLRIPFPAMLLVPALFVMIGCRAWRALKILLFSLATSATALGVYSAGGTCHYSTFHFFLAAMLISAALNAAWSRRRP